MREKERSDKYAQPLDKNRGIFVDEQRQSQKADSSLKCYNIELAHQAICTVKMVAFVAKF